MPQVVVDLQAAAIGTGIPASTLRRWIAHGWLTPASRRPTRIDLHQALAVRDHAARRQADTRYERVLDKTTTV